MMGDIFQSEEHQRRFLEAVWRIGKVYENCIDPEYGSALYVLTADGSTWNRARGYVKRVGIDFEGMLTQEDWSGGYAVLVRWAADLFNGQTHIDPVELLRLDERNFRIALAALQFRRYGLYYQ